MEKIKLCLVYFFAVNILTFAAFGFDKLKAKKGWWRISEKTLLLLGLFGGSVGQMAGMKVFRHKTQKWYFRLSGPVFFVLQAAVLFFCCTKLGFLQ